MNVTYKVGSFTTGMMIALAVLVDAVQFAVTFIPGFGLVISFLLAIISFMVFGIWFMLLGVSYFSGKKSGSKTTAVIFTSVVEIIPLLDALPATTLGVARIIYASRAEDKAAHIVKQKAIAEEEARIAARVRKEYTQAQYYTQQQSRSIEALEDEVDLEVAA